jgi:hypothetical protein
VAHFELGIGAGQVEEGHREHDLELDVGMPRRERRQRRHQHLAGERGRCADAQPRAALRGAAVLRHRGQQRQRGAHLLQVFLAGGRQRERLRAALEQRHAEQLLQRGDALADGAGGDRQLVRRALEGAQARRGLEGAQAVERGQAQVGRGGQTRRFTPRL